MCFWELRIFGLGAVTRCASGADASSLIQGDNVPVDIVLVEVRASLSMMPGALRDCTSRVRARLAGAIARAGLRVGQVLAKGPFKSLQAAAPLFKLDENPGRACAPAGSRAYVLDMSGAAGRSSARPLACYQLFSGL